MPTTRDEILRLMRQRILILDGATGTYLQQQGFKAGCQCPVCSGNAVHSDSHCSAESVFDGCNDALCLTHPEVITSMHRAYIDAGADIIETNSFNCNRFSLADYGLEDRVYDIARAAAQCARRAVDDKNAECGMQNAEYSNGEAILHSAFCTHNSRIFIAGSIGPTNRTLSMSADVTDPAAREITFDDLAATYRDCVRGLLDGGADILLVETVFDTLNAKAALFAINQVAEERNIDIPIMVSGTLADASGRTLSGQTVEAYAASLTHAPLISIGLNCAYGAKQLRPWLERLAKVAPCPVSVHPNAGLPNVMGEYDETPESFAEAARDYMSAGLVNIYGGCCGTTPAHIRAISQLARNYSPRLLPSFPKFTVLSGLEPLTLTGSFISVGERTNVAGSAKFRRLIAEGNYAEALSIARTQVEHGAQIIDICMDDGMIDGVKAMTHFLNLIAAEPDIARVPIMIDSSRWEVICAGLQCVQGKSIVNSISLKEGEEPFLKKARHIHAMGAATVVMLFDEKGQADTYERKMEVARRAYKLLQSIGFPTEDIIFDPNVLAVATGMPEHDDYARAFIEACRTIHEEMPEVHLSGGISNLSFSFRGNNRIRQAMHSVFLHHAKAAGLDMSIVNPAMLTPYEEIEPTLRATVEAVILNQPPVSGGFVAGTSPSDRLIALAQEIKAAEEAAKASVPCASGAGQHPVPVAGQRPALGGSVAGSIRERIASALLKGNDATIETDTLTAYKEAGTPLAVIDNYLMPAMEQVGKLFGEGQMFLPQVVKSARVMKKAVAVLEPFMKETAAPSVPCDSVAGSSSLSSPSGVEVILATVKGDVHDIGKNIVAVVTQCNGYQVRDLGVMVEPETIVDAAQKHNAAVIGLSGLITPSLQEMTNVLRLLTERGMTTPVIVGGATTSALHTAVKMAPEYPHGVVIRAAAAADNPTIIRRLLAYDAELYKAEIRAQQRIIRDNYLRRESDSQLLTIEEARRRRFVKPQELVAVPRSTEQIVREFTISELQDRISWPMFFHSWEMKPSVRDTQAARDLRADAEAMLKEMEAQSLITIKATARILPANSTEEDEIVIAPRSVPGGFAAGEVSLPFPRTLKDEPQTHSLADHILREGNDFVAPFIVTAGIGLADLQAKYRADHDEYRAIMAKLLCDRLAEAAADRLQDILRDELSWGKTHIRMAFGYGACPDHALKLPVMQLLNAEKHLGVALTSSNMITPAESICGLIFANTPTKYFNV